MMTLSLKLFTFALQGFHLFLSCLDLSQPSPGLSVVEEAVCHPEIIWNVPGWARQTQKTPTDALIISYFSLGIDHTLRQRHKYWAARVLNILKGPPRSTGN